MKKQLFRHGEIAFVKINELPEGLQKSDSKIIMKGSHGNDHSFDNGVFYPKIDGSYIFGYLEAKNTTLYHADHGKDGGKLRTAKLPDGGYELRKQNEFINNELQQIID
jgi:hypothetical protein